MARRSVVALPLLLALVAGASCGRSDEQPCDGWAPEPAAERTPPIANLALPPPIPNTGRFDVVRTGAPEKVFQLIGDLDRETSPPQPTPLRTETQVGLVGTDLGFPVIHKGRLYLVFGDALPRPPFDAARRTPDADVIGYVELGASAPPPPTREGGIALRFFLDADGQYAPVRLGGRSLAGNEVPYSGFSDGELLYVMFYVGASPGRSVIGVSHDDGRTFDVLVDVPALRAGFLVPKLVDTADVPGLASAITDRRAVLFWARPRQQEGEPLFAFAAPLSGLADPSSWRYYTGAPAASWSADVAKAPGLFTRSPGERCRGPFWIDRVPGLDRWLLVERCLPHHLAFRTADQPLGPWSDPQPLYDSEADGGLCRFMHKLCDPAVPSSCCDGDYQPELYCKFGPNAGDVRPYGPGVLLPYSAYDANTRTETLYFLMSVNNPYTVYVMTTGLRAQDGDAK